MLSPNLKVFIDRTAAEIRAEDPATVANLSDFELKALILDKIRGRAEEEADELVAVHSLTAIIKSLRQLAPYIR